MDVWDIPQTESSHSSPPLYRRLAGVLLRIGIVAILAAGGYQIGVHFLSTPPPQPSIATVSAKLAAIDAVVNGSGQVVSRRQANLSFQSAGRIAAVTVQVGDRVNKGDVVARLDSTPFDIQVDQARANLASAQAKLDTVRQAPRDEEIQVAQAVRDAAMAKLNGMLAGGRKEDIQAASDAISAAQAHLHDLRQGAQAADVATAKATVGQAQASLAKDQANLALLQRGPDPVAVREAQIAVEAAKDRLWSSQLTRDGLCGSGHEELIPPFRCDGGNAQVAANETAVNDAVAKLQLVQEGPSAEQLNAAKAAVASSQVQLESANARVAQLQAGPKVDEVAQATAALDEAKQSLALQKEPYSEADIAQQRELVNQANAQLALKKKPYTQADLAGAQAAVDQAKAELRLAEYNLASTSLVAPIDGIVSAVRATVGETAGPASAVSVVTVIDLSQLWLDLNVDETDIANIQIGQSANVTFDALAGKTFSGTVATIAPSAQAQPGVATYTVSITVPNADGVRPGMSGNAQVVYEHRDNVLVVPNEVVRTEGDHRIVSVLEGGSPVSHVVTVGVTGDKYTEVVSGLKEGDKVVLPVTGTNLPLSSSRTIP